MIARPQLGHSLVEALLHLVVMIAYPQLGHSLVEVQQEVYEIPQLTESVVEDQLMQVAKSRFLRE